MINSIIIRNFLLIDNLELDFYKGFSVLTGETGAGKSIFLKSILFCLSGAKFGSEIIKPGSDSASVSIMIDQDDSIRQFLLEKMDVEFDGEIIIKRIQQQNNRKKFFVNDEIVTADLVFELSKLLLEFHGQNLHNYLADPSSHMEILDKFAQNFDLRTKISEKFTQIGKLKSEIAEIDKERRIIDQEISYLKHIVAELQDLNIEEGEESTLLDIKIKLQSESKKRDSISSIVKKIDECNLDQISLNIQKMILKSNLHSFENISAHLEKAVIEFEEAKLVLSNIIADEEEMIMDIDEIEERIFSLRDASRKHNKQISELPNFLKESEEKLAYLESRIVNYGNLEAQVKILEQEYQSDAMKLRSLRKEKALELEKQINSELEFLKMEDAKFFVEITDANNSSKGADKITFSAVTNKGMKSGSIDKIASGGELARFMLAVRVCLFDEDFKGLIIFDEIDTGLGGQVASKIGKRLSELGKINQVLVISHQPQVAALADYHYKIAKVSTEKETISKIIKISDLAREQEVARMISADKITDAAVAAARELLMPVI
jgi:DNA repair protein RecN (Recombination protein N)